MTASNLCVPEPLIQMRGIGKAFVTDEMETHALANIDFELKRGEFVAICGPSGCGKSTLMSILGLLDVATTGSYRLKGVQVSEMHEQARARIRNQEVGFVFQAFNLIGDLTIHENVELPLTFRHDMSRKERRDRVDDALDRVGISHRSRHFPAQLSGGQQQRVAVARALVGRPAILLADEPTGNLDSRNGEAVMGLLSELHQAGTTLCMVTHEPRYAEMADRSVHIFDGSIVDEATLLANMQAEVVTSRRRFG